MLSTYDDTAKQTDETLSTVLVVAFIGLRSNTKTALAKLVVVPL